MANVESQAWVLPLSAESQEALAAAVLQHVARLEEGWRPAGLDAPGGTWRTAAVVQSGERPAFPETTERLSDRGKMVFIFSGQRNLRCGPGILALMDKEPVFRAVLEECDRHIAALDGWSLLEELREEGERSRLDSTSPLSQPALFAIEVGVSRLLKSWGIVPHAVSGLSAGVAAAACEAGAVTLAEGLQVALKRGRILQDMAPEGAMMAVFRRPEEVPLQDFPGLSIATYAAPELSVLSGPVEAIRAFSAQLDAEEEFFVRLSMNRQLHHPTLATLADAFRTALDPIVPNDPQVPMMCTVDGSWLDGPTLRKDYWCRSILRPVDLVGAVRHLLADGYRTFVEISLDPGIYFPIEQTAMDAAVEIKAIPTLTEGEDERLSVLKTAARVFEAGWDPDWHAMSGSAQVVR